MEKLENAFSLQASVFTSVLIFLYKPLSIMIANIFVLQIQFAVVDVCYCYLTTLERRQMPVIYKSRYLLLLNYELLVSRQDLQK